MNLMPMFKGTTRSAFWYVALVVLLPVTSLSILGLVYLWQNSLLLTVLASWLLITLIAYGVFALRPFSRSPLNRLSSASARARKAAEQSGRQAAGAGKSQGNEIVETDNDPDLLAELTQADASAISATEQLPKRLDEEKDWTEQDRTVWRELCLDIESRLSNELPWQALVDASLQLLSAVSAHYNPRSPAKRSNGGQLDTARLDAARLEYRFTLPEALLVISVASERYRTVVLKHIPFAERVTVASMVTLYERQHDIKTGYTWFNNVRRTARLLNPVAAAMGELRDQFTKRVFNHLSTNVQKDLKRLLLQEVVQVGIDLYSGKLKTSDVELQSYRSGAYRQDIERPPVAAEPLRIVLAGQTSAGKSSLVNALANTLQAEVDILPTTDSTVTHRLQIADAAPMHLIDTVGIDHESEHASDLLQLALSADMVLMIVRANQPARAPDQQLWEALQQAFASMPKRRAPPLILVMTHVDQLSPKTQWAPPYSLESEDRKALNMRSALQSALRQIGLPADTPTVPVCLSSDKPQYNIDAVASQLMLLQGNATLTQLNRRRVERGEQAISWRERWMQFKHLGQVLGRATVGKTSDRGKLDE